MRLVFQIFRKDIERLRPAIRFALILLAYWTFKQSTYSFTAMNLPSEGEWLNLALPFVWSLLIALAVNEDALAGDRQFWVALPCGWQPLLMAKAMFIAAFVHAPYFIATAIILAARGFNPVAHLPHLFWKQVVLLAVVLPAFGAAALVKNMRQFALVAITVAAAFVLTSNRSNLELLNNFAWDIRGHLAVAVLCGGAVAVIVLQFLSRRTIRSGVIGVTAAVAALGVLTQLPRGASAAIGAMIRHSDAQLSIRLASPHEYPDRRNVYHGDRAVMLPIVIEGIPAGTNTRFNQIDLTLTTPRGDYYDMGQDSSADSGKQNRVDATVTRDNSTSSNWQSLRFNDRELWDRFRGSSMTIHARILVTLLRPGTPTRLRPGAETVIDGAGRCINYIDGDGTEQAHQRQALICESPEVPSQDVVIRWRGSDPRPGYFYLREHSFYGNVIFPADPWLSPLHRGALVIGGTKTMTAGVGPQTELGKVLIDYTIPDLDLNRFIPTDSNNEDDRR